MHRRLHMEIRGAVQGVGFRPFVYVLAKECALAGVVRNTSHGVVIEVEGETEKLDEFRLRLEAERPPHSYFQSIETCFLDPIGYTSFEIQESPRNGMPTAVILPDIATCPNCLAELFDSSNRRYRYPFINCTHCGPRFSIINALPYDRANTTMRHFTMCEKCYAEYHNPADRRFHAQPNACPVCGPTVALWDERGNVLHRSDDAIRTTVELLRAGEIVAVKGLGGFHLMTDATNESAVQRLREAKRREQKPLAVMFPDLSKVEKACRVSPLEARLLQGPQAPIVLLEKLTTPELILAPGLAPQNPRLGVMLPYTPLHHLLMADLGIPVVATSGNRSDEPMCTDEQEALRRLTGIAQFFLVHNRPIARHVDDSLTRVLLGGEQVLRRARGYAPLPIRMQYSFPQALAVGAHQKNVVALSRGNDILLSQHIGDLETPEALAAFQQVVADLQTLYGIRPEFIVHDKHPDYLSTQFALNSGITPVAVQHHVAHVLACRAENELREPALGISWDGTGLGDDGVIWGGEFFHVDDEDCIRVATLRSFRLPGGAQAVKEPRRTALGVLYEMYGDEVFERGDIRAVSSFPDNELRILRNMLAKGINAPVTSSAGRLFDAVASLTNLAQRIGFEGQAAMMLEGSLDHASGDEAYDVWLHDDSARPTQGKPFVVVDWMPIILGVMRDVEDGIDVATIALRFHNALAEAIVDIALFREETNVLLSGGCFQNKYLTERTVERLRHHGIRAYWHQRVPPNDGGIALGQAIAVARSEKQYAMNLEQDK